MPPTATALDNAITRIQAIAKACTSVVIKAAPTYPTDNLGPLPMAITYLDSGDAYVPEITTVEIHPTVNVDFLIERPNSQLAYQQSDAIVTEFLQRMAGDPTLAGSIDTAIMSRDRPITWKVLGAQEWDKVMVHVVQFSITLKIRATPTT